MLTLALETSGFGGSLALLDGTKILGERILDAERRHAQTLVPEIQRLLGDYGKRALDCQLLAVSCGPGSFTGLRVGITCAKTLAYTTGAKIVAVPTFPVIAAATPADVDAVQVVMNAQREEFFVGRFVRSDAGDWKESKPLQIERVEDWLGKLQSEDVVSGPGLESVAAEVAKRGRPLPASYWQPTAKWVGQVGLNLFAAGKTTSCWDLEPYYVRKSAAEEKWDARTASAVP